MPRDANGNYTLPAGNPVVSGEVIQAGWANPTMSDIAAEMTNSLDRQGRGGMLAPFKFADGAVGAPALTFTNEPTSGFYRAGGNDVRATVAGVQRMRWTANGVDVWDPFANAGLGAWYALVNGAGLNIPLLNADQVFSGNVDFTKAIDITANALHIGLFEADAADPLDKAVIEVNANALNLFGYDASAATWRQFFSGNISTGAVTIPQGLTLNGETTLSSGLPLLRWVDTDSTANNRRWRMYANADDFVFDLCNDAEAGNATIFSVNRTASVIDALNIYPSTEHYANLTVRNGANFVARKEVAGTYAGYRWHDHGNIGRWWLYQSPDANCNLTMSYYNAAGAYQGDNLVFKNSNGYMGLGANDPQAALHILRHSGNVIANDIYIQRTGSASGNNNAGANPWMQMFNTTDNRGGAVQLYPTGGVGIYDYDGASWFIVAALGKAGSTLRDPNTGTYNNIGYKNCIVGSFNNNTGYNQAAHNGTIQRYLSSGHTWTTAAATFSGDIVTIVNEGGGNLTIACGGTMRWYTGSTITDTISGTRTLVRGGVATLFALDGAGQNNWGIYGTGIT